METLFKCFSDPTRLRILHLLANRGPELCVCDLVVVLQQPQGTVSRHLTQLRHLGLVNDRREGTWMHYSLAKPATKLHRSLLNCLKKSCDEEARLTADLERFDKLHCCSNLACCAPSESKVDAKGAVRSAKSAATAGSIKRKPVKKKD